MKALLAGNVSNTTQAAGIHVKQPLSGAVPFDVRTQLLETSQDVPTNEGLVVHLDGAWPFMHFGRATVNTTCAPLYCLCGGS